MPSFQFLFKMSLTLALSICTWFLKNQVWKIKFEKSSSTNWILHLQKSILKLIFADYTGSKNPVRNRLKIQFVELDFSNLIFQKSSMCKSVCNNKFQTAKSKVNKWPWKRLHVAKKKEIYAEPLCRVQNKLKFQQRFLKLFLDGYREKFQT